MTNDLGTVALIWIGALLILLIMIWFIYLSFKSSKTDGGNRGFFRASKVEEEIVSIAPHRLARIKGEKRDRAMNKAESDPASIGSPDPLKKDEPSQ